MANVVRFALSTAKTLFVPGAGTFIAGILDVDANNLALLTKTRYLVQPYRAVELGTVDAATPKPSLPAVPGPPAPDPYPQYLTPVEAASSPELRAVFGAPIKTVADLAYPLVIPHRGSGQFRWPEGNIDSYRISAEQFDCIDGGDLRMLSDGTFADLHDPTLDTTTNGVGSSWVATSDQLRGLSQKQVASFPASTAGRPPTTWGQISRELGGKVILTPEIKRDGACPWPLGAQGQAFAARLVAQGLTKSVIVGSFYLEELVPCVAAGAECAWFPLLDAGSAENLAQAAVARAAGVQQVCLTVTGGATAASVIGQYKALGFRVGVATINRHYDWTTYKAAGADWAFSEDPAYTTGNATRYRKTVENFGTGMFPVGMVSASESWTTRGTIANGRWFPAANAATTLLGQFCPVATPTAFTFDYTTCMEALGTDLTRHADVVVCAPDDRWFDAAVARSVNNGYIVALRPSGTPGLQLYKVVNGVTTSIGVPPNMPPLVAPLTLTTGLGTSAVTALAVSAVPLDVPSGTQFKLPTGQTVTTSAAAVAGATSVPIGSITPTAAVASGTKLPQAVPMRIQVAPGGITVTRRDTNTVLAANFETTHRGGYIHAGQNNNGGASGMLVSYADMSIS